MIVSKRQLSVHLALLLSALAVLAQDTNMCSIGFDASQSALVQLVPNTLSATPDSSLDPVVFWNSFDLSKTFTSSVLSFNGSSVELFSVSADFIDELASSYGRAFLGVRILAHLAAGYGTNGTANVVGRALTAPPFYISTVGGQMSYAFRLGKDTDAVHVFGGSIGGLGASVATEGCIGVEIRALFGVSQGTKATMDLTTFLINNGDEDIHLGPLLYTPPPCAPGAPSVNYTDYRVPTRATALYSLDFGNQTAFLEMYSDQERACLAGTFSEAVQSVLHAYDPIYSSANGASVETLVLQLDLGKFSFYTSIIPPLSKNSSDVVTAIQGAAGPELSPYFDPSSACGLSFPAITPLEAVGLEGLNLAQGPREKKASPPYALGARLLLTKPSDLNRFFGTEPEVDPASGAFLFDRANEPWLAAGFTTLDAASSGGFTFIFKGRFDYTIGDSISNIFTCVVNEPQTSSLSGDPFTSDATRFPKYLTASFTSPPGLTLQFRDEDLNILVGATFGTTYDRWTSIVATVSDSGQFYRSTAYDEGVSTEDPAVVKGNLAALLTIMKQYQEYFVCYVGGGPTKLTLQDDLRYTKDNERFKISQFLLYDFAFSEADAEAAFEYLLSVPVDEASLPPNGDGTAPYLRVPISPGAGPVLPDPTALFPLPLSAALPEQPVIKVVAGDGDAAAYWGYIPEYSTDGGQGHLAFSPGSGYFLGTGRIPLIRSSQGFAIFARLTIYAFYNSNLLNRASVKLLSCGAGAGLDSISLDITSGAQSTDSYAASVFSCDKLGLCTWGPSTSSAVSLSAGTTITVGIFGDPQTGVQVFVDGYSSPSAVVSPEDASGLFIDHHNAICLVGKSFYADDDNFAGELNTLLFFDYPIDPADQEGLLSSLIGMPPI